MPPSAPPPPPLQFSRHASVPRSEAAFDFETLLLHSSRVEPQARSSSRPGDAAPLRRVPFKLSRPCAVPRGRCPFVQSSEDAAPLRNALGTLASLHEFSFAMLKIMPFCDRTISICSVAKKRLEKPKPDLRIWEKDFFNLSLS